MDWDVDWGIVLVSLLAIGLFVLAGWFRRRTGTRLLRRAERPDRRRPPERDERPDPRLSPAQEVQGAPIDLRADRASRVRPGASERRDRPDR